MQRLAMVLEGPKAYNREKKHSGGLVTIVGRFRMAVRVQRVLEKLYTEGHFRDAGRRTLTNVLGVVVDSMMIKWRSPQYIYNCIGSYITWEK